MSYHTSGTSSTSSTSTTQGTTSYQGQTAPPGYHYMPNGTLMLDSEMVDANFENELLITGFEMDSSSLLAAGESRSFTITGFVGATFELEVKNEDGHYYNFFTKVFQTSKSVLSKTISRSAFKGSIQFPVVTDDDHYDISITATGDTKHTKYNEVRFGDGSVDINSTTGSNSLLMTKVIYQYVALVLTISPYSIGGSISGTAGNDTVAVSVGAEVTPVSFSTTFTVANDKALRIIKQPTHLDVLSFVEPVIGAAPIYVPGENIYPAITTAADATSEGGTTVNGASTGTTVTTHVVSSTIATVGDRVLGNAALAAATVTVRTVSGGSGKTFTISEAISIADDLPLTFSNQMNYRWPIDNFAHVLQPDFTFVPTTNLTADSVLADYLDTTTVFTGTNQEKTYINQQYEAVSALGFKPTITNGEITAQAGTITFDKQQALALAGDTLKAGGYGQSQILSVFGYDVVFANLAIALTPITTTTTAASAGGSSTSVVLTSRNGILDAVSTVSGIGINPNVVDPTVASGAGAVTGAGTIVLSAAQSLESGTTLTFANAGLVATITGDIRVLKAGTASQALRFDINKLLTIT